MQSMNVQSLWKLYTNKNVVSIGNLNDKDIVLVPDSSLHCAVCGTPVDGPYCHGCTLIRMKFEKDLFTYCVDNGVFQNFQDTSESSNDNTNVVNAPREPSVVDQDPGVNISQNPPQIDHNCCYECGDSLNGIFCQQCICESCGKDQGGEEYCRDLLDEERRLQKIAYQAKGKSISSSNGIQDLEIQEAAVVFGRDKAWMNDLGIRGLSKGGDQY
ncbi:hypothetical protein Tco_1554011 [Tanacetum coccineum]